MFNRAATVLCQSEVTTSLTVIGAAYAIYRWKLSINTQSYIYISTSVHTHTKTTNPRIYIYMEVNKGIQCDTIKKSRKKNPEIIQIRWIFYESRHWTCYDNFLQDFKFMNSVVKRRLMLDEIAREKKNVYKTNILLWMFLFIHTFFLIFSYIYLYTQRRSSCDDFFLGLGTRVQIRDEAVTHSHSVNILWKGMPPTQIRDEAVTHSHSVDILWKGMPPTQIRDEAVTHSHSVNILWKGMPPTQIRDEAVTHSHSVNILWKGMPPTLRWINSQAELPLLPWFVDR